MERYCVFWNLQRFFDPAGLPVARSLGGAGAAWTLEDYERKLFNVAACLKRMTEGEAPLLLAFAEVESLRILRDIRMATGWDELVAIDEVAPDSTLDGFDVALMYDGSVFSSEPIRARSLALDNRFATRDLLDVELLHSATGKSVVVEVAHWPSRIISEGGTLRFAYSLYVRRLLANVLKFAKSELVGADGIAEMPLPDDLLARWSTPCFAMGDFNDEPFDLSVREALKSARFRRLVERRGVLTGKALVKIKNYLDKDFVLFNPSWDLRFTDNDKSGGTYYRSEWRTYDQVLVSHGALRPEACVHLLPDTTRAFRTTSDLGEEGMPVKMTTRSGFPADFSRKNPDGVSDHFPLVFRVRVAD